MFGWLFRKPPVVPDRLVVEKVQYFLDGGTTQIIGTDADGKQRVIGLSQHRFPRRGGVGWLYLDGYKVRRRSPTEGAIVQLLRSVLAELKARPQERQPGELTIAESLGARGAVLFCSPDLAEAANLSATQQLALQVSQMLEYIESDRYGQVT
jgi:hypothetical protein